jgi:hypothetical protein
MDSVMAGLPYCFVYLDDVLVASSSPQQHLDHLREVLARLQEHGLVLNVGKCQFGVPEIDYLGHRIFCVWRAAHAVKSASHTQFSPA